MAVTTDILQSYRDPGGVMRRMLAQGPREDRAAAVLMLAAALIFVAGLAPARRAALLDPTVPLEALVAGRLMAAVFVMPLVAYAVAWASHLVARLMGGRGSAHGARLALFWALLAVSPLMLVQGLIAGLAGPGPALTLSGAVVFGAFLWIWFGGLRAAAFGGQPA
ncbi:MAG: YIP1 family protein [Rhodobacteraceae bacterium]|nr:YIP1 family protein [Paracoccaceae bacterium]